MTDNLLYSVQVQRAMNAVAVGTSAQNSDIIDTAGFDGVQFIVAHGTITDGTPSIKVQQGADSGLSDAADLTGTSVAVANTDDNKLCIVDVWRPGERYVRCVVTRGGATGSVIDGIVAVLYGAKSKPTSQHADVAAQEAHQTPAEGTA